MTSEIVLPVNELSSDIDPDSLPPILLGNATPAIEKKVTSFYLSVAEMFERWVEKHHSPHTQRSYRGSVMNFIGFLGIDWPKDGTFLFTVKVADMQQYREWMVDNGQAPNTINHRISAVSGFYKYMREVAIEMRLPINVVNPAHPQFIARENADPVEETKALDLPDARRLRTLPSGETVLDYRDRAILDFYLYSGARVATGCRLKVSDFTWNEKDSKIRINEKGNKRRTIGLHYQAATSMRDYIEQAGLTSGMVFRRQLNAKSKKLGTGGMTPTAMYYLVLGYLQQLPGAMMEREEEDAMKATSPLKCRYSPHSLRATTATLLLDAGEDIRKVQKLLGHRHVTTTQIYDKRRVAARESASHSVPI